MTVTIYTNDNCVYCRSAKRLLDRRGVSYEERYVAMDDIGRRAMADRTGGWTLPQIVINNKPIGGYQQLVELDHRGGLRGTAQPPLERAA